MTIGTIHLISTCNQGFGGLNRSLKNDYDDDDNDDDDDDD